MYAIDQSLALQLLHILNVNCLFGHFVGGHTLGGTLTRCISVEILRFSNN